MLQSLQRLSRPQRQLIFFLVFGGILMAIVALTIVLVSSAINTGARPQAFAIDENLTVREFATLPDNDTYPAGVAAYGDGVYTGSYASGAIWYIDGAGQVTEIPGTREGIGAVSGLAVGPDGALYIVDQYDTDVRSGGGDVKRLTPDGTLSVFATIEDERGFVQPDDVALDGAGRVYVTDRGRNEVWRFEPDGSGGVVWWTGPQQEANGPRPAVTGLAYDATTDSMILTDPETNTLYRVAVADGSSAVLYQHPANAANPPGFDGVTVTPDGTIYIAALGQNGIVRFENDSITYVAGQFRGSSDVDYAEGNRLFVSNWDQSSLALPLVEPRLPFGIDVIELP